MKVEEILIWLKQKSELSENEWFEIEKAFGEIIYLKLIKRLGEELNIDQQKQFIEALKVFGERHSQEMVFEVLKKIGFDKNKAREYLIASIKQALIEIVEILNDRLSAINKKEILELIG